MNFSRICFIAIAMLMFTFHTIAQFDSSKTKSLALKNAGWISVGSRSTISSFSDDGLGLGTGGQFRVQISNQVNTDWYADYIIVSNDKNVRSTYCHIGWSVLFYPLDKQQHPKSKLQPYILAGHCFDYNKKTIISSPEINKERWGSAVQAGIGTHINLTNRFDISLTSQYMIHLTRELEVSQTNGIYAIEEIKGNALEGHLLTTISINYKLFKLWQ